MLGFFRSLWAPVLAGLQTIWILLENCEYEGGDQRQGGDGRGLAMGTFHIYAPMTSVSGYFRSSWAPVLAALQAIWILLENCEYRRAAINGEEGHIWLKRYAKTGFCVRTGCRQEKTPTAR